MRICAPLSRGSGRQYYGRVGADPPVALRAARHWLSLFAKDNRDYLFSHSTPAPGHTHKTGDAMCTKPVHDVGGTKSFDPHDVPGAAVDIVAALLHPKAVSPLEALRPPPPPSAADARAFAYGSRYDRGTLRSRRYANINAVAAAAVGNAAPAASVVSSGAGAADEPAGRLPTESVAPIDLSKLTHNRRPSGGAVPSPGTMVAPAPTAAAFPSPSPLSFQPSVTAAPLASSCSDGGRRSDAVTRAKAAIASHHADCGHRLEQFSSAGKRAGAADKGMRTAFTVSPRSPHRQVYHENFRLGWPPEKLYAVVADVASYQHFLPWCISSVVHSTTPMVSEPKSPVVQRTGTGDDAPTPAAATATNAVAAEEMIATLGVGFSFFKEQYTSRVTLVPHSRIVAVLADADAADHHGPNAMKTAGGPASMLGALLRRTGVSHVAKSVFHTLSCSWEFRAVPGRLDQVEVTFEVSFEFRNPLHAAMLMNNIVSLMTRSFVSRCERLYGPPSVALQSLSSVTETSSQSYGPRTAPSVGGPPQHSPT